jgi:hypothetical protein
MEDKHNQTPLAKTRGKMKEQREEGRTVTPLA